MIAGNGGPRKELGGPDVATRTAKPRTHEYSRSGVESRQVSWWAVYEYVRAWISGTMPDYPHPGTPAWCALGHRDPVKLAAVLWSGVAYALRLETAQEQHAEAAKAVAAAIDWPGLARQIDARATSRAYIKRLAS